MLKRNGYFSLMSCTIILLVMSPRRSWNVISIKAFTFFQSGVFFVLSSCIHLGTQKNKVHWSVDDRQWICFWPETQNAFRFQWHKMLIKLKNLTFCVVAFDLHEKESVPFLHRVHAHTKRETYPSFPSWDVLFTSKAQHTHICIHIHTIMNALVTILIKTKNERWQTNSCTRCFAAEI